MRGRRLDPVRAVLLRAEEVHDVSGASRPVAALREVDMQHVDGLGFCRCDRISFNMDPYRFSAAVAFRNDRRVLAEIECAAQGVHGAHSVKSPSVCETDLVVGRPGTHGIGKCHAVRFFDDDLFDDQGLQDLSRSVGIDSFTQKGDHVANGYGPSRREDAILEREAKASFILIQSGNDVWDMKIFKGVFVFAGCHKCHSLMSPG